MPAGVPWIAPWGTGWMRLPRLIDLAFFLEHLGPIHDEQIERFLRRAFVGNDVVVNALLHVEKEFRVGRFSPEIDNDRHRLQELRRERRAFDEAGCVDDGLGR